MVEADLLTLDTKQQKFIANRLAGIFKSLREPQVTYDLPQGELFPDHFSFSSTNN